MALPAFATLETRLAAKTVSAFSNLALALGAARFTAVLDRNVQRVGEFGQFIESRDQLTINKADIPELSVGTVLTADAAAYTAAELLALPRASWTLDALESDDGFIAVWWAR